MERWNNPPICKASSMEKGTGQGLAKWLRNPEYFKVEHAPTPLPQKLAPLALV